jgi:hypothetical protein
LFECELMIQMYVMDLGRVKQNVQKYKHFIHILSVNVLILSVKIRRNISTYFNVAELPLKHVNANEF